MLRELDREKENMKTLEVSCKTRLAPEDGSEGTKPIALRELAFRKLEQCMDCLNERARCAKILCKGEKRGENSSIAGRCPGCFGKE
jgi:hypothetical protein